MQTEIAESETEESRADIHFEIGKDAAEGGFICLAPDAFQFHADWQNYLAGLRAAVL